MSKSFVEVFNKFIRNPNLPGSYAESIYKAFVLLDDNPPKFLIPTDNRIILGMKVNKDLLNIMGAVHGGALGTILDTSTTLAILKADRKRRKTVSAQFSINFLNPLKVDEMLLIEAECTRIGKTLAFSEARFYSQDSNKIVATGSHIKAVLDEPFI